MGFTASGTRCGWGATLFFGPRRLSRREVAPLDGIPSLRGWLFRIGGRLDMMRPRPGPAFFGREATAVPPALFGGLTAARMILTGERLAGVLVNRSGQRKAERGDQVGETDAGGTEAVSQASPEPESREGTHGRKFRSPRMS